MRFARRGGRRRRNSGRGLLNRMGDRSPRSFDAFGDRLQIDGVEFEER